MWAAAARAAAARAAAAGRGAAENAMVTRHERWLIFPLYYPHLGKLYRGGVIADSSRSSPNGGWYSDFRVNG
jgi:hypothetical protein